MQNNTQIEIWSLIWGSGEVDFRPKCSLCRYIDRSRMANNYTELEMIKDFFSEFNAICT